MGKKIFILEDDVTLLTSLQAKFSVEGFDVIANNGGGDSYDVIKLLKVVNPNFIILDLILPKIDGFELLGLIKADESLAKTPIFIFSNLSDDDSKAKCQRLGAEQYFVKTEFNIDQFITKIKKTIANKEKNKNL